mgnify:CR=1 FL=1
MIISSAGEEHVIGKYAVKKEQHTQNAITTHARQCAARGVVYSEAHPPAKLRDGTPQAVMPAGSGDGKNTINSNG